MSYTFFFCYLDYKICSLIPLILSILIGINVSARVQSVNQIEKIYLLYTVDLCHWIYHFTEMKQINIPLKKWITEQSKWFVHVFLWKFACFSKNNANHVLHGLQWNTSQHKNMKKKTIVNHWFVILLTFCSPAILGSEWHQNLKSK